MRMMHNHGRLGYLGIHSHDKEIGVTGGIKNLFRRIPKRFLGPLVFVTSLVASTLAATAMRPYRKLTGGLNKLFERIPKRFLGPIVLIAAESTAIVLETITRPYWRGSGEYYSIHLLAMLVTAWVSRFWGMMHSLLFFVGMTQWQHQKLLVFDIDMVFRLPFQFGITWFCGSFSKSLKKIKQMEQEAKESLEREVLKRTAERDEANRIVLEQEREKSIRDIAGGLAHNLNNMLTAARGYFAFLEAELRKEASLQSYIEGVKKALESMTGLVLQFKQFAGIDRFETASINLNQLIEEINGLLVSLLSTIVVDGKLLPNSVPLKLELQKDLPLIEGGWSQIEQILVNLLINAREAIGMKTDGSIVIRTRVQEVDDSYVQQLPEEVALGKYVVLEVQDNGEGMDEATSARIFGAFFSTKFTGRGLGLASVRGTVRAHKGAISFYTTKGVGTTFTIIFPVSTRAAAQEVTTTQTPDLTGRGTVLVVDDHVPNLGVFKRDLVKFGYEAICVSNGEEAIDLVRKSGGRVDVVIVDLMMPGMDGAQVLSQINEISHDIPVVVTSGHAENEVLKRIEKERVAGYLKKPYSQVSLGTSVKDAIERRRSLLEGRSLRWRDLPR